MSKSMYSLILSDEVIRAADRESHSRGMSRSAFIDQVLAGHLSISTPEQRIEDIFATAAAAVREGTLQIAGQSGGGLQLRSVLRYKYNPTIRYAVEISSATGQGVLRASARTSSAGLIHRLDSFYRLWNKVERLCYPSKGRPLLVCEFGGGRYARTLNLDGGPELGSEELGQVIGAYVRLMHSAMEAFFEAPQESEAQCFHNLYMQYENYLRTVPIYL